MAVRVQNRPSKDWTKAIHAVVSLESADSLAEPDRGLAVVSTLRVNGTIQLSLVNAGVAAHPSTHEAVLAL